MFPRSLQYSCNYPRQTSSFMLFHLFTALVTRKASHLHQLKPLSSTPSFHNQVSSCLLGPLVRPHTCSIALIVVPFINLPRSLVLEQLAVLLKLITYQACEFFPNFILLRLSLPCLHTFSPSLSPANLRF